MTRRSYEFFVIQHVITVIGLLISLVAHLQVDLKQGIKYFYASAAVWGFSILVRALITLVSLVGIGRFRGVATIKELPGGVTRVDIETSGRHAWQAGQHIYLRLTKLNPFVSCRIPESDAYASNHILSQSPPPQIRITSIILCLFASRLEMALLDSWLSALEGMEIPRW